MRFICEMVPASSLANLRPGTPGCAPRNPLGINGVWRAKLIRDILDEPDEDDPKISRIRAVVLAMVQDAKAHIKESPNAGRTIVEQYAGRPPVAAERVAAPTDASNSRSTLDLILATYRERLLAGELSEGDLSTLAALLMAAEKTEAEIIAKILGDRKGTSSALKERAEEVMRRLEARTAEAATASETPTPEATVPATEEKS